MEELEWTVRIFKALTRLLVSEGSASLVSWLPQFPSFSTKAVELLINRFMLLPNYQTLASEDGLSPQLVNAQRPDPLETRPLIFLFSTIRFGLWVNLSLHQNTSLLYLPISHPVEILRPS